MSFCLHGFYASGAIVFFSAHGNFIVPEMVCGLGGGVCGFDIGCVDARASGSDAFGWNIVCRRG